MSNVILRTIEIADLESYYELNKPSMEYHKLNGPYYEKETEQELRNRIANIKKALEENTYTKQGLMIADFDSNEIIGEVSWYYKSKETNWIEIGIVVFNEKYWGKGIGSKALKLWVDKLFLEKEEIVRLGLTTWSGNERMMKLAEKIGFICEANYRKARIVNGEYYDSLSYGILREEWDQIKDKL